MRWRGAPVQPGRQIGEDGGGNAPNAVPVIVHLDKAALDAIDGDIAGLRVGGVQDEIQRCLEPVGNFGGVGAQRQVRRGPKLVQASKRASQGGAGRRLPPVAARVKAWQSTVMARPCAPARGLTSTTWCCWSTAADGVSKRRMAESIPGGVRQGGQPVRLLLVAVFFTKLPVRVKLAESARDAVSTRLTVWPNLTVLSQHNQLANFFRFDQSTLFDRKSCDAPSRPRGAGSESVFDHYLTALRVIQTPRAAPVKH